MRTSQRRTLSIVSRSAGRPASMTTGLTGINSSVRYMTSTSSSTSTTTASIRCSSFVRIVPRSQLSTLSSSATRSLSTFACVAGTTSGWATTKTNLWASSEASSASTQSRGVHQQDESWKATTQVTGVHHKVSGISDAVAYAIVKAMRVPADLFFRKKYIHRAVVLETVAAVPGMVAGMLRHLRSLRTMSHDGGWIHELLDEAENERMHLLTFIKISQPTLFERLIVLAVQGVFFNVYFVLYVLFPRTAHRIVGYLEEEAVISYTQFLAEIDSGKIENVEAPKIAKDYWKLPDNARLRDVVVAVQLDEAHHRDVNHRLSDKLIPFKTQPKRDPQGFSVQQSQQQQPQAQ